MTQTVPNLEEILVDPLAINRFKNPTNNDDFDFKGNCYCERELFEMLAGCIIDQR
jgi:hypothetical protein